MTRLRYAIPFLGVLLLSGPAWALEVVESTQTDAMPDKAWEAVGDFCAIADWHPAVEACEESDVEGTTRRTLTLSGGGTLVEDLVSRDDENRTYTYRIVEGPLPVANYESTISVAGNDNMTTIAWNGTFDAAEGSGDAEAEAAIRGIYKSGLEALAERATSN